MTLNTTHAFSSARSYLLTLHRDARPDGGELFGRVEHLLTGERNAFNSAQAWIEQLTRHAFEVSDRNSEIRSVV